MTDLHCEALCAWANSSLDLHHQYASAHVKHMLLYYVLSDLTSGTPQVLLGDKKGLSQDAGQFFELISGRGSHAVGMYEYA